MSYPFSDSTVTELVTERPARSRVFEDVGIKYCCAGSKTFAEACEEKGLNPEHVAGLIQQSDTSPDEAAPDWAEQPVQALVHHILETHHAYLKRELPRMEKMADKVAKVHGKGNPNLVELAEVYRGLAADLEAHLAKEENILFPAILNGGAIHCGSLANPIRVMEAEHAEADRALEHMRALTDNFTPPDWACNTYRALFDGLRELDEDLKQHVHKENDILFPRVLA